MTSDFLRKMNLVPLQLKTTIFKYYIQHSSSLINFKQKQQPLVIIIIIWNSLFIILFRYDDD